MLAKILVVAAVTATAAGSAAVLALVQLGSSAAHTEELYTTSVLQSEELAGIRTEVLTARSSVLLIALAADEAGRGRAKAGLTKAADSVTHTLGLYRPRASDPAAIEAFTTDWTDYLEFSNSVLIPLVVKGDLPGFVEQRAKGGEPRIAKVMSDLDKAARAETAEAESLLAQARSAYDRSRTLVLVLLVGGLALAAAAAFHLARQIAGALASTGAVAQALARGDLSVRSGVGSRDEIGRMAADLDAAAEALRTAVSSVSATAEALAASSEELSATTNQIASAARESSTKASVMAASSEEVTSSVANVASAAEEMSASIREIADNAAQAATTASSASGDAVAIQETVGKLGESSQEIGKVIALINAIAEQTNLLALNATIEAARAGEAGKGFAVVANEVKELAQQTAEATSDISSRVEAIQTDTQRAVAAIAQISGSVASISALQTTIAGAVEEQTATTSEMSRSVQEAAGGSQLVSTNVQQVADAADETTTSVVQAQEATAELARMAGELRQLTSQFQL
jgi:methyl-accepting chemotaxis protein